MDRPAPDFQARLFWFEKVKKQSNDIKFNKHKAVQISMKGYIEEAIEDCGEDVESTSFNSPMSTFLFDVNDSKERLPREKADLFHRIVAKLLFVCTRRRPDIQLTILFLCTRTTKSDADDWKKLI